MVASSDTTKEMKLRLIMMSQCLRSGFPGEEGVMSASFLERDKLVHLQSPVWPLFCPSAAANAAAVFSLKSGTAEAGLGS